MRWTALVFLPTVLIALPYHVYFDGLEDQNALNSIYDVSDLVKLEKRPPSSLSALRYRAEGDIPDMLKVLRAYGYYDAFITYKVRMQGEIAAVTVRIDTGEKYLVSSYQILKPDCQSQIENCLPFSMESLGISSYSKTPLSVQIVNAELNVLTDLANCGYPLASVEKREVIVDMQSKEVEAKACVDEGPFCKFGPLEIVGLKETTPRFIQRRIAWKQGDPYRTIDTEETQKRLLNSNLFSSVYITHSEKIDEQGELSMKMQLSESKHRQISLGPFYATVDGPGGVLTWTHRNLRGMGESLSLKAEVSKRYLTGITTYKMPDFLTLDQTYRIVGQIERQNIRPYIAFIYRGANYIDRILNRNTLFSVGLEVQHINVSDSANNGSYLLADLPFLFRWNYAGDLMNPKKGYTVVYQPHLFQSLDQKTRFFKQRLTTTFYLPFVKEFLTFATRVQIGSITGAKQRDIALPLLFLGGSEDDLRGYRYLTVSPLNNQREPLGGRSAIFISLEARFQIRNIGIVPFSDFGTVSFKEIPTVDEKWFKSLGLGLRYFTAFGPLRLDVGFPLNRREGIDPKYRIYGSIGQAF